MARKKLNQREYAKVCGKSEAYISRVMHGDTKLFRVIAELLQPLDIKPALREHSGDGLVIAASAEPIVIQSKATTNEQAHAPTFSSIVSATFSDAATSSA